MLECLQRALRVADAHMDTAVSVELFVEILNRYVYYFDQQNETVIPSRRCIWITLTTKGHYQVLERTYRAYSLQSADEPGELLAGESETPFPANFGLYYFERIRRCGDASKVIFEFL